MTDRPDGERRKLYAAAQVTSIVCDAMRDNVEDVAGALCSEPEFLARNGDKEQGCHRLASDLYFTSAATEVELVLDEQGLNEYRDEVEHKSVSELAQRYLQTLEEFDEIEEQSAMAKCLRDDVVGLAECRLPALLNAG